MIRERRGFGRRRVIAVAAIAIAIAVAAPELGAPAGAASARPATRFAAGKRLTPEQKKAKVAKYIKKHPGVLATHLKAKAEGKKTPKKRRRPYHYVAATKVSKAKAKAKARALAAKKKKKKRRAGAVVAKKKKKGASQPLSATDWMLLGLLALTPFIAVFGLLIFTDYKRRPRAPSRSKRRRTLVITPLNRNH